MTKGDLDGWLVWGRPLKPVALGTSILMLTLVVSNVTHTGIFGPLWLGDVIAGLSAVSFICLTVGWFGRHQMSAEVGLLLACTTYLLRASMALFLDGPGEQAVYLSIGAAVITGGAFLLEHWDRMRQRGR